LLAEIINETKALKKIKFLYIIQRQICACFLPLTA